MLQPALLVSKNMNIFNLLQNPRRNLERCLTIFTHEMGRDLAIGASKDGNFMAVV